MAEAGRGALARPQQQDQAADPGAQIAALRASAAHHFDPVRFHFIETLARRVPQHQGTARRILAGKLAAALATYRERLGQRRSEVGQAMARTTQRFPETAGDLQRLFAAGDLRGVSRFVAERESQDALAPLADLRRHIARQSPDDGDGGSRGELKALRQFRTTWSRLSVDRQVTSAIEQAPANAGPLNSHRLVLRSLVMMREISPDYLKHFMAYADTLLALDQAEMKDRPTAKKPPATKTPRK
jgi:hypothetical protein